MLDAPAANLFLTVASVCIILLTLLAVLTAFVVISTALEVRAFVRKVNATIEEWAAYKRHLARRMRFVQKFVRILGTQLFP